MVDLPYIQTQPNQLAVFSFDIASANPQMTTQNHCRPTFCDILVASLVRDKRTQLYALKQVQAGKLQGPRTGLASEALV